MDIYLCCTGWHFLRNVRTKRYTDHFQNLSRTLQARHPLIPCNRHSIFFFSNLTTFPPRSCNALVAWLLGSMIFLTWARRNFMPVPTSKDRSGSRLKSYCVRLASNLRRSSVAPIKTTENRNAWEPEDAECNPNWWGALPTLYMVWRFRTK